MGRKRIILIGIVIAVSAVSAVSVYALARKAKMESVLNDYTGYFKSVYDIMAKNYYLPVRPEILDTFLMEFRTKIFELQLKDKTRVFDDVKHMGAGILVTKLKDPNDSFTNFYPSQMVKEFKSSVLGYEADIGIEGAFQNGRFIITQVEPRSDAATKGVSIGDEVLKVENVAVTQLSAADLKRLFSREIGKEVMIELFAQKTQQVASLKLISSQYFKQSVFVIPTGNPRVACLRVKFFNEETGNEMRTLIDGLNRQNIGKLVIDLRDNSGGPPLAAWDMSGIFLGAEQKLFYFLKRDQPPMGLVSVDSPVRYNGVLSILVNKNTGSAAELLAGIMQAYNTAGVIGENSAGKVYLKSLFDLSDGSVLELTVAKGYLFNGNPIDAGGIVPNIAAPDDDKLLAYAVNVMESITPGAGAAPKAANQAPRK